MNSFVQTLLHSVSCSSVMPSTTPADALWHLSQQKTGIYEVQRKLEGTGTLLANVNQKQVEVRGLQLEPMKCEAGFRIRPHNFTLINTDSYCSPLKGSKMTSWYSNRGTSLLRGAALLTAVTISGPERRGHMEFKRDEVSMFTLHFQVVL